MLIQYLCALIWWIMWLTSIDYAFVSICHLIHSFMATLINFDSPGSAENLRQFEEAMKHGHIRSWMWKLLLYGAAGSGKTSVKEMILGNPPPVNRTSTPLAMRPTTVYRINLDGKEFKKITTLQERRAFLARALLQSAPNLKRCLRAARPKIASSSSD